MEMTLKNAWKKFVDKYMRSAAEQIDTSKFKDDEIRRYDIVFKGVVQGVGFRYEVWTIAQKLGLVGFVENLSDGSVYAEIQGPENKIVYLIDCLKSVSRIQIEKIKMDEIEVKQESHFEIAN